MNEDILSDDKFALAKRSTITDIVNAWIQCEQKIRDGYASLHGAITVLQGMFDSSTRHIHYSQFENYNDPNDLIHKFKLQVWESIIEKLELRSIMSLRRIREMDDQLKRGDDMPDITYDNVMAMLKTHVDAMPHYLSEKVLEVYEWLRPSPNSYRSSYVTNKKSLEAGIGKKLIITWGCESWTRGEYRPSSVENLRALDQVMHLLDGAEFPRTYYGDLCDAMMVQTKAKGGGNFESKYFIGKCFKNRNLHLQFKRDDLLAKFNQLAGGARLTDKKQFS